MAFVTLDMTNIGKDGVVPGGWYPVQITEGTKVCESKEGKPYLLLCVTVTDGEFQNRMLRFPLSLLAHARFNFDKLVTVTNIDFQDDGFDDEDFLGKEILLLLSEELYNEKPQNQIKDIKMIGGLG